jgi:hypothetical protein
MKSDDEIGRFASVLTLGNLQGDQSKVQLSNSPSFIKVNGDNRFNQRLLVCRINPTFHELKGEIGAPRLMGGVPCGC